MLRFFYNAEINNQSQAGEHPSHKQRREKTFVHTPACLMYKYVCNVFMFTRRMNGMFTCLIQAQNLYMFIH